MPPKIYNAKNAKNAKKAKKAKKPNLLQGASRRARPQRLILPPWPRQKRVGGGGPPLGVSIEFGVVFEEPQLNGPQNRQLLL